MSCGAIKPAQQNRKARGVYCMEGQRLTGHKNRNPPEPLTCLTSDTTHQNWPQIILEVSSPNDTYSSIPSQSAAVHTSTVPEWSAITVTAAWVQRMQHSDSGLLIYWDHHSTVITREPWLTSMRMHPTKITKHHGAVLACAVLQFPGLWCTGNIQMR